MLVRSLLSLPFLCVALGLAIPLFSTQALAEKSLSENKSSLIEPDFKRNDRRILSQRPVWGRETSTFGYRSDPIDLYPVIKHHNGIDYRGAPGTAVRAAAKGTITKAKILRGYGRVVYVDHGNGIQTRYAHLQDISAKVGQHVIPGQKIGTVGSSGRATGPHLHFEARVNGRPVDPYLLWTPDTLENMNAVDKDLHASRH